VQSVLARALPLALVLAGCARAEPTLAERAEAAAASGAAFLVARQDEDGAWRSPTYGFLREGWALTAACTKALVFQPGDAQGAAAAERGLAFLAGAVGPNGEVDAARLGLAYPVYTAALAALSFSAAPRDAAPWLALLARHQLTADLGWSEDDAAFGGWSYSAQPLRKGAGGPFEADLSSTLFALGALRRCGVASDDERVRRALRFVERCQNLPLEGEAPDPARDDGGFFLSPSVALQNKAGGTRETPLRLRAHSYGSPTADGLRALLRCGLAPDHPRVRAARAWLERNFDAARVPAAGAGARAGELEAAWTYWSWSAAHALVECGAFELEGGRDWGAELAAELCARQLQDGSWSNPHTLLKEDDPLVATPMALAALALARAAHAQFASAP
jgi:squalene-hopene/tetraprenyl-beta-curcumene cyclase